MNETDRRLEVLVEFASKEVADGGKVRGFFGRGDDPMSRHVAERRGRRLFLDREQTYFRIPGLGERGSRVVGIAKRPLHVRLPRANPNLADQHVLDRQRVVALYRQI